jgi:hypothetical protein
MAAWFYFFEGPQKTGLLMSAASTAPALITLSEHAKVATQTAAAPMRAQLTGRSGRPNWTGAAVRSTAHRLLELLQQEEPLSPDQKKEFDHLMRDVRHGFCDDDKLYQRAVEEAERVMAKHPLPPSNPLYSAPSSVDAATTDPQKRLALQNATRKKIYVVKIYGQMVAESSITAVIADAAAIARQQNDSFGGGKVMSITPQMMQPNSPFMRRLQMLGITLNHDGNISASLLQAENDAASAELGEENIANEELVERETKDDEAMEKRREEAMLYALESSGDMDLTECGAQYGEGENIPNHYERLGIPDYATERGIEIAGRRASADLYAKGQQMITSSDAPEATAQAVEGELKKVAEASATLEDEGANQDYNYRSGHEHNRAEAFKTESPRPEPPKQESTLKVE